MTPFSEIEIPPIPLYRDEEGYLRLQGGLHRIKAAVESGSTMLRKLRFQEIGMALKGGSVKEAEG